MFDVGICCSLGGYREAAALSRGTTLPCLEFISTT